MVAQVGILLDLIQMFTFTVALDMFPPLGHYPRFRLISKHPSIGLQSMWWYVNELHTCVEFGKYIITMNDIYIYTVLL
jgi:hypothetical protein